MSNASRHPSRAVQATLALPAACQPGQLAPASLNRARDCPAPCSYCRQHGRKRAQNAMLASNRASSDLSGCYTTASARFVAGGMPAPRCSELTAPRTRLKAEGRRRLRLAAGERKLRRSPQKWHREPPPAAQRPSRGDGHASAALRRLPQRPILGQSRGSDGGRGAAADDVMGGRETDDDGTRERHTDTEIA